MSYYDSDDMSVVEYGGKIHYLDNYEDIDRACSRLYKRVSYAKRKGFVPVAFDTEWPVSFRRGSRRGKTALIQVCVDLDHCYLFHVSELNELPPSLEAFLSHPRVRLVGVGIEYDLRKLEQDYPEIDTAEMIEECIDLGDMYDEACGTRCQWGLKSLVQETLGEELNKPKRISCSRWDVWPLSEEQMEYAAIDVYVR